MIRFQRAVPFWIRAVLLAGVACIAIGAGLISYRFYTRPVTLTLAVGAFDDKGKQIASIIAGRLAAIDSPIRLKIETSSNSLDAAKALVAGKTDLAIVRADAGDLTQARTIAVTAHDVVMIVAPPGSTITSIAKLRDHAVGVVGADINHKVVEALKKEYDLARANVTFKDVTAADAQRAVQSREVAALLLVAPLSGKTLSFVRSLFHDEPNSFPVLIPIESAAAIADKKGPYESFDIPKGTMRGAPAVPSDDVTTLRVADYLIANRHLNANLAADLTKKIMNVRRDLVAEQPALSGIASPDVDPDAYISVHPGAAAFYNGTQQSFMDRYGNAIYLTPMAFGALASIFAAAWRFLGVRPIETRQAMLASFCSLPERIRQAQSETELAELQAEIDSIVRAQLEKALEGDESAPESSTLIAAAHRLDNLIHQRRTIGVAAADRTSG